MLEAVAMWRQILSRIFKVHESRNAKEHHPGWFLQAADLLERFIAHLSVISARPARPFWLGDFCPPRIETNKANPYRHTSKYVNAWD
jgi:hypothetical protein